MRAEPTLTDAAPFDAGAAGKKDGMDGNPKLAKIMKMRYFADKKPQPSDLITLRKLEEADLMTALRERFEGTVVYTSIGDIIVSVNPFTRTENSSPEVQKAYADLPLQDVRRHLPPHIFCLVGEIYSRFQEKSRGAKVSRSLSILISGESGAGKTEAMKLCVRHLGMVSEMARGSGPDGSSKASNVGDKLMSTNPVMEPIGNAKTVRNNNSSRFGKHFDIQFDTTGQIIGAKTSARGPTHTPPSVARDPESEPWHARCAQGVLTDTTVASHGPVVLQVCLSPREATHHYSPEWRAQLPRVVYAVQG